MKRSYGVAGLGVFLTAVLGTVVALSPGCGILNAGGFLGLETCDILNCDGIFFGALADDHDDGTGTDRIDDPGAHDDEGEDQTGSAEDRD